MGVPSLSMPGRCEIAALFPQSLRSCFSVLPSPGKLLTKVFGPWDVKQQRQEAVISGKPVALPLVYLAHVFLPPGTSTPSSHTWLNGSPLFSLGDLKCTKKGIEIKPVGLWPVHSSLLRSQGRENLSVNAF